MVLAGLFNLIAGFMLYKSAVRKLGQANAEKDPQKKEALVKAQTINKYCGLGMILLGFGLFLAIPVIL